MAAQRSHGVRRPRRPVLLALAAVALLGLIALAARSHAPTGGGGSTHRVPGDLLLEYVLLIAFAVGLVVMPLVAHAFWTNRRQFAQTRRQGNWMVRVFVVMAVAILLFAGRYLLHLIHDARHSGQGGPRTTPPGTTGATGGAGGHPKAVAFDWVPVIVVGSLMLVGAIVAVVVLRHQERAQRTPETIAEQLSNVLDDTLDDLRAESDPRRAVIAAYARMERALAWFGLPRRVFEAPLEYLARVLLELRASTESVRRLTGLFERAKFSTHDIGPGLKDDAIEALVAVRDELRAYR